MTNTGERGERRPIVGVRMSQTGIDQIKALMLPGVSKSDVVRVALSEALRTPAVMREVRRRLVEMSEQR